MVKEIINKYFDATRKLQNTYNQKKKLFIIIDFFRFCESKEIFPYNASFIIEFTPIIIEIFKTSNVNFCDPSYLLISKSIIIESKKYFLDKLIQNEIENVLEYINLQLLKLYFYIGEIEEGLILLKNIIGESNIKENYIIDKKLELNKENYFFKNLSEIKQKLQIVKPEFFKESRAFEILREIKYELDKLNSFSNSNINLLLIEDDAKDNMIGVVQGLECKINTKENDSKYDIVIENIIEMNDKESYDYLQNIIKNTKNLLIKSGIKKSINKYCIDLNFEKPKGIYEGKSFGLGAALISFCSLTNYLNGLNEYSISTASAFTGSIDNIGNIIPISDEVLRHKLYSAFFSWIKYVIVPKNNLAKSIVYIDELKRKYPKKNIKVIGIEKPENMFIENEVLHFKKIPYITHYKKEIKKHSVASIIFLSIFILIFGLLISRLITHKQIKPLPIVKNDMYLIYSPDRDTSWIFRNLSYKNCDTIEFGDVAIGDSWSYKFGLYNNSDDEENIEIELEGSDKDEFELIGKGDVLIKNNGKGLEKNSSTSFYVKLAPTKKEGEKTVKLKIFSEEKQNSIKYLFLKGYAKRYQGYALSIKNGDDNLIIEPGSNILEDDFTFSCWIKPHAYNFNNDENIVCFDNNPLSNNKYKLRVHKDSSLCLWVYGRKADIRKIHQDFNTKTKIKFDEWNYIAFNRNKNKMELILNDEVKKIELGDNIGLREIQDCIYFGSMHPEDYSKIVPTERNIIYLVDEIKIYHKKIDASDLINYRYEKESKENDLFMYYDFDEANSERIFDLSPNDIWATLKGGTCRVCENAPLSIKNKKLYDGYTNKVLKISGKGLMKVSKKLFDSSSSFSIQFDAKINMDEFNSRPGYQQLFYIIKPGEDIFLEISKSSILFEFGNSNINFSKYDRKVITTDNEWHNYLIAYSKVKNTLKLFIDEKEISSIDSLYPFDISKLNFGFCFGNYGYYAAPRYYGFTKFLDNIKIFNSDVTPESIKNDNKKLIAYWTFEKTDGELVYDEINNVPAFLWEDYEIVNENIPYTHLMK